MTNCALSGICGGGVGVFGVQVVGDLVAPVLFTEGFDVLLLGELGGLDQSLAEVGQGVGGAGFDVTHGDRREKVAERGGYVVGGGEVAGEVVGDVFANFF